MSYSSNYLKLRQEREGNTKNDAGGSAPSASSGEKTATSGGSDYNSKYLALREQRASVTESEKAEAHAQEIQSWQKSASPVSVLNNTLSVPQVKAEGYYSMPELGTQRKSLEVDVMKAKTTAERKQAAMLRAEQAVKAYNGNLPLLQQQMQQAWGRYQAAPTQSNQDAYKSALQLYTDEKANYDALYGAYSAAYEAYVPAWEAYNQMLNQYVDYITDQQNQYTAWRGTVRDADAVRAELTAIGEQVKAQRQKDAMSKSFWQIVAEGVMTPMAASSMQQNSPELQALLDKQALLQEEYDWSQYFKYADLMDAEDFEKNSRYVSTANGKNRSAMQIMADNYSAGNSGWDDPLYEYVNGNKEAGAYLANKAAAYYGSDNAIGAFFGRTAGGETESQQMTEDEVKTFNYLYATQGKEAAHAYYEYLRSDLNYRQRQAAETQWKEYAAKNQVGSSLFSVAMAPAKGLSYLGQVSDYITDGTIDQNASYNQHSYISSAIREKVAEQIENSGKWGKVGSFAYQTGMSMGDFLLNTAITGGNSTFSLAIMSTGAAADATIEAKDRGLNDNQAFLLGTIAGAAEILTEKVSLDTLLDGRLLADGTWKYIVKNMAAEGSEEVGSDLINLLADILISKDESEWRRSIAAYVEQGKREEAFGLALADQAVTLGLDFVGGALSGGIMAGGNAAINYSNSQQVRDVAKKAQLDQAGIQDLIDSGLESDPDSDSYKLASKLQKKLQKGQTITVDEQARLMQANEIAMQEEQQAQNQEQEAAQEPQMDIQGQIERNWGGDVAAQEQENANDTGSQAGAVAQNGQNVTQAQANDTAAPAGVPLSVAEQNMNGGNNNVRTDERTAGPAAAKPAGEFYTPGGNSLLPGGGQRHDGTSAGEQAGSLAGSPEQRRSAYADRSRATVARQNYARSLRLEKVSSLELGLQNGTEARTIQVMPEEHWDAEMSQLADRIYNETGKGVTYVMGRIQIRGTGGTVGYARGVITGDRIIVQADHLRIPMEQIADHEAYHAKVDFATENRMNLNAEIRQHILATFSAEQFQQVLDKYIVGMRGVIDVNEARTGEEFEAAVRQIEEEIFADAYAGINAFGAGADQFTGAVNEKMDQLYMGKIRNQDNGTEEPTGPPSDRYSFAGENANNADLDALARAKEMRSAGVADETIRQQTGWHTGMDGKWRWEIDDSGMEYSSRGDMNFRQRNKNYDRYRQLTEKQERYMLELSDEQLTEAETKELQRLREIYSSTFRKPGRVSEDALPMELLSDYVKHDDLFEAYPQLRKTRLRFADLPEGTRGRYDPEQDVITLSENLRGKPQDTLIHEIQHVIQKTEGFTGGASVEYWKQQRADIVETIADARRNLDMWLDDIGYKEARRESLLAASRREKTMEQHWKDMEEFKANSKYARQIAACEAELAEFQRQYDEITHGMTAYEQYENTAGEIEARDAASRRQLTAEQRRSVAPERADDRTVFVEDVDETVLAEMDAEYGPQLQPFFDPDLSTEEIDGNIQQVAQMDPVTQISGEEFAKGEKDLITQVEEFFAGLGNVVFNAELGDVVLDRRGIKSDVAHGIGRKKAAAFAAVPDVIEQGLIVDYQQNWKGRGYDTAVVAAPITIGAEDHIAAVILTRSNQTNRFYVHEVLTTKNGAMPFKTGTREGYPGGDAPSVFSILDKIRSVKNETGSQERFSVDDSDDLSLQLGERFSVDDVDSHGHSLTPEQQEFFAQSQARDSSGRLLVLYHQTDGDFTIFDTRHPGAGSRDSGTPFGIFLKRSAGDIGLAGKKQMALYANITNPLRAANREDLARQLYEISRSYATISDKHKQLDAEYREKFERAKKAWRDYIIEWRAANPDANRSALNDDPKFNELFDAEDAIVDEWTAAADLLSTQAKEAITEDLRKAGYDGVFLENDVGSWGRRTDAIIALDPQQVKNISNKTPTSNPDIRYSVDDAVSEVESYMDEGDGRSVFRTGWLRKNRSMAERIAANRPQTETTAFRRWFGNSVAVNMAGEPLLLFHGTKTRFTTFETDGKPVWFSSNPVYSAAYAGDRRKAENLLPGDAIYGKSDQRVIPAYIRALTPADFGDTDGTFDQNAKRISESLGIEETLLRDVWERTGRKEPLWETVNTSEMVVLLKDHGFDSIKAQEHGTPTWGVFESTQAKSAIANKGTFDGSHPDIRYSVDDEGFQQRESDIVGMSVRDYANSQKRELKAEETAWRERLKKNGAERVRGITKPEKESLPLIAKKDLRNTVLNLFSIQNGQRAEVGAMIDSYADRLIKNGSLTEEDRKSFFDRMYDAGVMVMPAEEYSAFARSHITDGRIYVSDSVKSEFGDDWADIRRRAFAAGVYLVNDRSAPGIDQWNATLSAEDMLPGLFDSEETDQRSILERILQVAEEGKDEHLSLAEYTSRLSQQEGISEDVFLDNMERQLDWALRTFAEKARLEVHLRDRTSVTLAKEKERGRQRRTMDAYRDLQRQAKEREERKEKTQKARERKELQELQQKTLKQLQWLSKNRYRAPEELQATWDEVLGDIDLYAVGVANEMRWSDKHNATWKDLAQMYKDAMKNDPNFLPSKELERIVTRLDGTKIADMDIGALQDLYKAAIGLRTEFYNRNNVVGDEMQRLFAEVYTDAKREIESAPGGFTGGVADKFLNLDQLTPMNVLQRMAGWDPDGAFYSMAKQLERGERDMRAYSVKAQKMLQDFLTEHEDWVKKADGQGKDAIWYEVEVPQLLELHMGDKPIFGPTVKVYMTPAQKVHMYLESKNLDNLRHMTGGRTFVNKDLYSRGKRQEALSQGRTIRLAPETVKKLVSDLTPEEMELARILDRYYNTFATQEINKVSNILYGYDKAMGKNYAPIYTNRNYTKTEFGVFDTTAEGVGNLKGRQYAVNPSYNISAFDAFERHVDQTARFCGMAIPARNWTTLMNWREKNNSTGDVITHKWGEESKRYITDLITTLQGGDDAKSETISSGLSKLQSNYITAIFGANPSIVMKQLGSIPLAGAYLDARNMPTPAQIAKIDRSLISKYTQELEWRTMGYTTPETKQLKDNPNWTQTNKVSKFVFGGGAITAMDGWAASTLWPWAENKVRREYPELAVGTKAQIDAGESAFYKKVAEEFEIAVSRSQSVSDEMHQGTLRKSKNPITKAFTMFRSDSAQTYNTLRQKIGEAKYYMRTGAKDKVIQTAKKAAGTAFVAMLLNAAWSEAVSFLMALWKNKGKYYRDDEDELTFQSVAGEMVSNMLGSFAGVVTGGEELFELIGNIVTGDTWYGIETPGMEQLNDLIDVLVESGSGMRDLVAGGWDILKNGGDLGEYFGKHSGQILGSIKDLAEAAAMYLPGLPVSNLEAYLVGAMKWISPELGTAYDDLFSDVNKSDLSGMDAAALKSRAGRILDDRRISDSDDTAAALAALYEAGYKTAIPSDVPTTITVNGDERKLSVFQQQTYEMVWSSIVGEELDEVVLSDIFQDTSDEIKTKMLTALYNHAADQAKKVLFDDYETSGRADDIAAFKEAGLSMTQYLRAYAQYSYLNAMDIDATTKATMFSRWVNKRGYSDAQNAVIKDSLKFFSQIPAAAERYDGFMEVGLEDQAAYDLANILAELTPEDGSTQVTNLQRYQTVINEDLSDEDKVLALSQIMTDAEFKKLWIGYNADITPNTYVELKAMLPNYDKDGNGTYTQAEVKAAVDAAGGTRKQKAAMWQLQNKSWSPKNNPYDVSVGQKIYDALNSEDEEDEDETFADAVMKQLLGE